MEVARAHYADEGWKEAEADKDACKTNPFDLILTRDGVILHAEVKGTTLPLKGVANPRIAVTLTANEVKHARHCGVKPPCHTTELLIVTDIMITRDGDESIGSGGEAYVRSFSFNAENPKPTMYRYTSEGGSYEEAQGLHV